MQRRLGKLEGHPGRTRREAFRIQKAPRGSPQSHVQSLPLLENQKILKEVLKNMGLDVVHNLLREINVQSGQQQQEGTRQNAQLRRANFPIDSKC